MKRVALAMSWLACAVMLALPVMPVSADLIISSDREARGVADTTSDALPSAPAPSAVDAGPSVQVGAFLSGEEWWEIPLGVAFVGVTGFLLVNWSMHGKLTD